MPTLEVSPSMPDSRTLTYKLVGKAEGKEDLRLMADELRGIQAVLQTLKKDASGASALQGAAAAAREQARVARSEADAVAAAARQYTGEIKAQRAAQEALTASVRATGVAAQLTAGDARIMGVMIESHLEEGRQDIVPGQPLKRGVSVTDACISFEQTVPVLAGLAEAVRARRQLRRD